MPPHEDALAVLPSPVSTPAATIDPDALARAQRLLARLLSADAERAEGPRPAVEADASK